MSKGPHKLEVTVVVSTKPVQVLAQPHWSVEQLIRQALDEAGKKGEKPGDWELRTEDGVVLEPNARLDQIPITSGLTLYLDPKIGGGG
jgi:hypothetical protein